MQSLYRKYRPATFAEVIGQDHVIKTLKLAVEKKQIGHAYLFSGGRGIGKTSIARILAKEIGVTDKDLYEIDAASHTGVDDIRELRDGASTLPLESPYKVYILDEVHMLSKGAFNALLKILEEPPAHVIFILATTDMHKVPDTVLSRCEVYTLNRPTRAVLRETITAIIKKEKYTIDAGAADLLALIGDGSFRDTLSLVQQVMTGVSDAHITELAVQSVTGAPTHALVRKIIDGWTAKDPQAALAAIADAHDSGAHIDVLYTRILDTVRAILLIRCAPDMRTRCAQNFSPDDLAYIDRLVPHTTDAGKMVSSKLLRALLDIGKDIRRSDSPQVLLEVLTLELAA